MKTSAPVQLSLRSSVMLFLRKHILSAPLPSVMPRLSWHSVVSAWNTYATQNLLSSHILRQSDAAEFLLMCAFISSSPSSVVCTAYVSAAVMSAPPEQMCVPAPSFRRATAPRTSGDVIIGDVSIGSSLVGSVLFLMRFLLPSLPCTCWSCARGADPGSTLLGVLCLVDGVGVVWCFAPCALSCFEVAHARCGKIPAPVQAFASFLPTVLFSQQIFGTLPLGIRWPSAAESMCTRPFSALHAFAATASPPAQGCWKT